MSKRVSRTSPSSAAAEFVLKRSGKLSRAGLLLGTALGCSIAVFSLGAPGTAWAGCTTVTVSGVDQVTCSAGGYPSGIVFTDNSGNAQSVTLASGVDTGGATDGVFAWNQAANAYSSVIAQSGAIVIGANDGIENYTTAGGNVYVKNYGFVSGGNRGIYADAVLGGNVYVVDDGTVLADNTLISAKANGGNIGVYSDGSIGEAISGDSGTTVDISTYAVSGASDVVVKGGVSLISENGYAVGISTASTFDGTNKVYAGVSVQGYSGALGIKTSSAYTATTTVYGDVTVTSGYAGKGGGPATGIITVGSDYAATNIFGNVTVTALNGVALGIESASFNGSSVYVSGSVLATGDLGATAVYDVTLYDHNATVQVGGDVSAYSNAGSAMGVFAAAGNVGANDYTYVGVNVGGNVTAIGATSAIGIEATNLGGEVYVTVGGSVTAISIGDATGIETYAHGRNYAGSSVINVGGDVGVLSLTGNATGIKASAYGNLYTTVGGDVTAVADGGVATGVESYVIRGAYNNNVHVYGDVTASGYAGAIGVLVSESGSGVSLGNVVIGGNVTVESVTGEAIGVLNEGYTVSTTVGGNVTAYSEKSLAIGAYSISSNGSYTNIGGSVSATGYVAAGVVSATLGGAYENTVIVGGSVSATGYAGATGVEAIDGDVNVTVTGDVTATTAYGNATGVFVIGDANITIGGNAIASSTFGNATAVYGNSTGYLGVHVGGNVGAYSFSGNATGIKGYSGGGGNLVVGVGGNVVAESDFGVALGIAALGDGNASVNVIGNVFAKSYYGEAAIGAIVFGNDYTEFNVGGNLVAVAPYGAAIGAEVVGGSVYAHVAGSIGAYSGNSVALGLIGYSPGYDHIVVGGNVTAIGRYGATGIKGYSAGGDVNVHIGGDVFAFTEYDDAIGVKVAGDSEIYIGGNATAIAPAGNATAVWISSFGGAYVHVVGNVYAGAYLNATGVFNDTIGYSSTVVGGSVEAKALLGQATGVYAYSETGSAFVSIGGNVTAISYLGDATGVYATSATGGTVNVTGSVGARAYGEAIGVEVLGPSYANVTIGGNVTAIAYNGDATGVTASGDDVHVSVGGTVTAYSEYADATGVSAVSTGYAGAGVDGNVYAIAPDGDAIGVTVKGGLGGFYAAAYVGGNVTAEGEFSAIGVSVTSTGENFVTVDGNVLAIATDGSATGIFSTSAYGSVTVSVGGSVTAAASAAATGVAAYANGTTDGTASVSVTGDVGVTAINGNATGIIAVGGYSNVNVGGNVSALSGTGNAFGIEAVGDYGATVDVGGNVYARSVTGTGAIGVVAASDGDVSVTVGGTTEVIGNLAYGVVAESLGGGDVTVDVGNVVIHQYGATSPYQGAGVVTYTTGVTNITAGDIYTTGNFTDGIRAGRESLDNGDTYVTVNSVETTGAYSPGVYVIGTGNATVTIGTAYTKGLESDGVFAVSTLGGVSVTSTMVKTLGDYSAGIYAAAGGPVVVNSGTSVTYGYKSDAVVAINTGTTLTDTVAVYSGTAITHGDYSDGIYASGHNSTYVKSNLVKTYGYGSDGIVAESYNGPVTIISGAVHTYYTSSDGIVAETYNGNISVTSGTVLTDGGYSAGILAASTNGSVSVASTYVRTLGNYSYGIEVEAGGDALVTSYEVKTYGDHSDGIGARSLNGNTTVNSVFVYTKGNYSTGIYAESRNGNVTVNSDTVITVGAYSDGVHGYSYNGTTTINSDYVKTSGYHSEGIYAYGWLGATVNSGGVMTYGAYADGIHAISHNGMANVTSNYVLTTGTGSVGIYAYGSDGVNVNSGTVKTYGEFATGIMAVAPNGAANVTSHYVQTSGDFAPGISAYGYYGATVNNTGLVRTYGYRSDGIDAFAYDGDVNVTSDEVVTYGDYSTGIFAKTYNGDVNVTVTGGVFTYGYDSPGVVAESYNGNVNVYNYGTIRTEGDFSDGIFAGAIGGTAFIYNGGLIRTYGFESAGAFAESIGADTYAVVVNFGTIEAYEGPGIVAESIGGHAEVYNFGHVYGAFGGVILESTEGSYLYNKGSIMGGDGFAIGAYGASVYIENKGAIYGYAILNTANNTLNNQGRWFAYGDSYFGYGNDVVNNHGIIEVAPFSSTPTTVVWSGVTVFNNSNLVDLRNGHTGDVFILDGNGGVGTVWNGLAGSTLAVDASLTTALSSDEMIVGAANGSTSLIVHDVNPGSPGSLNFVGTTVVHAASGTASNFTWGGEQKGFIQYELQFFSGPVDWNIVALPGQAAFEMLKAPEMAQDFWRRTGDAWSAREQEVRDSMWGSAPPTRGEGWEMWAQAQVGGEQLDRTETFNVQGMNFSPNLSTDSDWRGFQMGGDNWTSKNWLWGFTGGFLEQNSVFHFDKNSFDITGWNVGAYTGFTSGAFFANALVKGDWYDIKANMHTVPALETFSGDTWGAKGETGFRFGTPHLYFEPLADLAWTSTHLDNANFTAQDTVFTFGNATSLRGSIGARVGGQWGQLLPYVGLYAAQEFDGKNKMAMITGGGCTGCEMDIEDLKPGAYERADFGFTTTSWNGLEGFLKGETEFGGKTSGFTGRLGVRWRW